MYLLSQDFQQQHVVRESGLEPVVRVRDNSQKMSVLWTPATFIAWLNRLRDWDPVSNSYLVTNSWAA